VEGTTFTQIILAVEVRKGRIAANPEPKLTNLWRISAADGFPSHPLLLAGGLL